MEKIVSISITAFIVAGFIALLFKYLFPSCEENKACAYFKAFIIVFLGALAGNILGSKFF